MFPTVQNLFLLHLTILEKHDFNEHRLLKNVMLKYILSVAIIYITDMFCNLTDMNLKNYPSFHTTIYDEITLILKYLSYSSVKY